MSSMVWPCTQKKGKEDIGIVAEMRIQGKTKKGRPKKRWIKTVKDNTLRWRLFE